MLKDVLNKNIIILFLELEKKMEYKRLTIIFLTHFWSNIGVKVQNYPYLKTRWSINILYPHLLKILRNNNKKEDLVYLKKFLVPELTNVYLKCVREITIKDLRDEYRDVFTNSYQDLILIFHSYNLVLLRFVQLFVGIIDVNIASKLNNIDISKKDLLITNFYMILFMSFWIFSPIKNQSYRSKNKRNTALFASIHSDLNELFNCMLFVEENGNFKNALENIGNKFLDL